MLPSTSETVQFTVHGIGTAIYGERDYWPYGSFVTTEWAVLAWIPVFPTFSKRISYAQTSPYATYDASGYYVHETTAPNLKQVFFVYGWFGCLIALFVAFGMFQDELGRIAGDEDRAAALWFLAGNFDSASVWTAAGGKVAKDEGVETRKPRARTTRAVRSSPGLSLKGAGSWLIYGVTGEVNRLQCA